MKVVSASDVWAAGASPRGTLLLHGNGTAWRQVASPPVRRGAGLLGISGTSPRSLWAVGGTGGDGPADASGAGFAAPASGTARPAPGTGAGPAAEPLILRWNGTSWHRVSIPVPANGGTLIGVDAVSGHNAWAVGCTKVFSSSTARPLVLHWNGTVWK